MEILKIFEERGIQIESNRANLEAAILSYRNSFVKTIINLMKEQGTTMISVLYKGFLAATKNNNIKGGEILLNNGMDINHTEHNRLTLLHYAAKNNSKELFEILLSK